MNKAFKKTLIFCAASLLIFSMTACSQFKNSLDVVGKESITSFDAVLKAVPDNVQVDEMNVGYSLLAPDGTVRYIWSEDWSRSPLHDVMLEFDAAPFLEAGLDPEKLPEQFAYYEDKLMVGMKLGEDALKYSDDITPLAAFEQIVNLKRESIGYHASLDHYGVNLGNGNMFEWAKNMSNNDKDIVFVLDPTPFIAADVNPEAVEGWIFAKVEVMDAKGKTVEVDKLLKPFDLK